MKLKKGIVVARVIHNTEKKDNRKDFGRERLDFSSSPE